MKPCNCYISKMGMNCDRIADIVGMVANNNKDAAEITTFLEDLVTDGTLTIRESIVVATQIGIYAKSLSTDSDSGFTFSDN